MAHRYEEKTFVEDRSRIGSLVHDATSQGRIVTVIAYLEGLPGDPNRLPIESRIACRTQEQAEMVARVLRMAVGVSKR